MNRDTSALISFVRNLIQINIVYGVVLDNMHKQDLMLTTKNVMFLKTVSICLYFTKTKNYVFFLKLNAGNLRRSLVSVLFFADFKWFS